MPIAFIITPAAILAIVLIASGVAKLRHPDDAEGWAALGIPAVLRRRWLIGLHPIGELLLAVALLAFGGALGMVAAVAALLLFGVYLALVWRAKRTSPDATCACFGERRPITTWTVVRNAWLFAMAIAAVATIGHAPLWGGVIVLGAQNWSWMIAVVAAVLTVLLVRESGSAAAPAAPAAPAASAPVADDPEEYVRLRTPAVPVQLAGGLTISLRELARSGPMLLLAVSETCGSCAAVIERIDAYRALLPEVTVRFLLKVPPEASTLTDTTEPQTLHDPRQYVSGSIADWPTPTALLIGADGYLAGGPVSGPQQIEDFVADVYENLHGERPPREA